MSDLIKVVFIDDDKLVCRVVQKFLLATGKYAVSTFTEAKKGLAHIKSTVPDVVLLDVHMPGMSGVEMLQKMKEDPFLCHIPIAMLTGDDHEDTKDAAMSSYAEAYILKPATQESIDNALSAIIKNSRRPDKIL